MILTKTSTRTDKSTSSQERLISLSPNLIFRRTPFYFVTYGPFCNLIGLQYTPQREHNVVPSLGSRPCALIARGYRVGAGAAGMIRHVRRRS